MKTIRIFFYVAFAILASPLFSQSISHEQLVSDFTSEALTEEKLAVFDQRAIQKLKDYANYIEIISTGTYNNAFRKQAVDMALELFSDLNVMISDSLIEINKEKKININDFFLRLLKTKFQKVTVSISDIQLSEPLKKTDPANYSGTISFKETVSLFNTETKPEKVRTYQRKALIVLKKVQKDFGSKKKIIWEVMLGGIL